MDRPITGWPSSPGRYHSIACCTVPDELRRAPCSFRALVPNTGGGSFSPGSKLAAVGTCAIHHDRAYGSALTLPRAAAAPASPLLSPSLLDPLDPRGCAGTYRPARVYDRRVWRRRRARDVTTFVRAGAAGVNVDHLLPSTPTPKSWDTGTVLTLVSWPGAPARMPAPEAAAATAPAACGEAGAT